ncbi:hypothetical protein BH11PAT1_BH11PAT1_1610 [soil metagenome]
MVHTLSKQVTILPLLLLLLGLSFFLLPTRVQAETALNLTTVDGLVFVTYPDFSAIEFTYQKESIQTISVTEEKHFEVSLSSYVFDNSAVTPTPTQVPTATPITTTTETPTPTPFPSNTITPTPTLLPTPTTPAIPPVTPTPEPMVIGDDIWDKLAACESNGNWKIDTGNGYFGGLQFSQDAWQSVGGSGKPTDASREEQIEKGKKLQVLRGWGVWGDCAKKLHLTQ